MMKLLPLASLIFCAALAGQTRAAGDSCRLAYPPRDAAVSGDHGSYYFVFPRHVSSDYSGCQIMWDEQGRQVFIFRFLKGKLTQYSMVDHAVPKTTKLCKYDGQSLAAGSSSECPTFDSVKGGLPNVEPEDEPKIPKDRDPRR